MRWLLAVLLLALGLAAPAIAQTNVVWGLTSGNNVCVYDQSPSRVCVTLGLLNSTSHTLTLTGLGNFSSLQVGGAPVATTSGALTNGSCVSVNSLGQFVTTDGPCTVGGGGGTITPALAGQLAYYVSAGSAVSGATTGTGVLSALGVNTGTAGSILTNGGALGTPSSGVAANLTGLPISTGVSGLGTGVSAALGVNVGVTGSFIVNSGAPVATTSGALVNGHCVSINATGNLVDAGAACVIAAPATPRQVATRAYVATILGGPGQCMVRTRHSARANLSSVQVAYGGWAVTSFVEANSSGNETMQASIEYPVGTFTQLKWSGSTTGTILPGANLLSDAATVSIPTGATFYVRAWFSAATVSIPNSVGIMKDVANGEAMNYGATATNLVLGGTITDNSPNNIYPVAIIGLSSTPAICIFGDSIALGTGDSIANTRDVGYLARSVGGSYGYINAAVGGDAATYFVTSHAKRLALEQYCTHAISEYGVNDLNVYAESLTTTQTALSAIWAASTIPIWQTTITPVSASTDSWTSFNNQTPSTSEPSRESLNTWIRSVPPALAGYFEAADQVEFYEASGHWLTTLNGYAITADGLNPGATANALIISGRAITPQSFSNYH